MELFLPNRSICCSSANKIQLIASNFGKLSWNKNHHALGRCVNGSFGNARMGLLQSSFVGVVVVVVVVSVYGQ